MARYRGPRVKIVRRLGELPGLTSKVPNRTYPAGQHGPSAGMQKMSQYRPTFKICSACSTCERIKCLPPWFCTKYSCGSPICLTRTYYCKWESPYDSKLPLCNKRYNFKYGRANS
ncbi:unnamed protein product [Bathycoccus prasinos]